MKKFNLWGFIFVSFVCLVVVFVLLTGEEKTTTTGASKPSRLYDEYNCEDFETWQQAQEVFESAGGVENDVHHLDRDNDNIPYESLL